MESWPDNHRYRAGMTDTAQITEITLEAFEAEARDFLDANARKKEAERKFVWGEGSD